jgi:hypothetical protein
LGERGEEMCEAWAFRTSAWKSLGLHWKSQLTWVSVKRPHVLRWCGHCSVGRRDSASVDVATEFM